MIINETEKASQPWSNSCPSGELDLVLLACLPSIASSVEQAQTQNAEQQKTQEGISRLKVKSQQRIMTAEERSSNQPTRVMKLGATHIGTRLTTKFQQGWSALSIQVYFPDLQWQKSRCLRPQGVINPVFFIFKQFSMNRDGICNGQEQVTEVYQWIKEKRYDL